MMLSEIESYKNLKKNNKTVQFLKELNNSEHFQFVVKLFDQKIDDGFESLVGWYESKVPTRTFNTNEAAFAKLMLEQKAELD